ncbi:hypothetical protein MIR68_000780 [Amoeboaphelidium protococcarum]|nr:hypothetical protein MIR68_000780 [Amoeboaphelidium protococcarum]
MNAIVQNVEELLLLFTAGGVAVSAAGLVSRIGPGRAVWLALRSRVAFKPNPQSIRREEIAILKSKLADKDFGQSYLVVTGEKGVGKTCLLNTATSKTAGVIRVKAQPQHSEDIIIKNALQELANPPFKFMNPLNSAPGVIFWYRIFTLGRSPIVVINATERKVGQEYACLTGAVRTLVEDYHLRVVVYGSPNSLDETLFRTKREDVIDIKPMTRGMIWKIVQLQDLFKFTKNAGLDDIVFAVLGGVPADYEKLCRSARIDLQAGGDAREVIGIHLCGAIFAAIRLVEESCGNDDAATAKLMKLFQETGIFTKSTIATNKLQRPTPDKVFREVERDGVLVLVPASNAIGIVLQNGLTREPSLNELEELVTSSMIQH